jgi:hypothetical protein
MSRKQTTVVVFLALFAGFLGGLVSQQVGLTVLAQAGPAEKIEAQEFRLVDGNGRLLGLIKPAPTSSHVFSAEIVGPDTEIRIPEGGAIMLFDSRGQAIWAAPETIDPPARMRPLTKAK